MGRTRESTGQLERMMDSGSNFAIAISISRVFGSHAGPGWVDGALCLCALRHCFGCVADVVGCLDFLENL